jgi:hypothetical protein
MFERKRMNNLQFHDKVNGRLALIGLKELYYIGMIQPKGNLQ